MAALLAANGVSVICIDRDDPAKAQTAAYDGRTTAISYGSRRVIEAAGAWQAMEKDACPIAYIKIMETGSPTLLEFNASDVDCEAFGWIIENRIIRKALYDRLQDLSPLCRHLAPTEISDYAVDDNGVQAFLKDGASLRARLVIGADGRGSFTRQWMGVDTRGRDYNQCANVCVVHHENPHNNMATEDFRGDGPFAVLPMMDDDSGKYRSAVVWTQHTSPEKSAMMWDDESFAAAITERFPAFYGAVRPFGARAAYPLGLAHAQSYTGPRMALIADAAHGIHPIAGQGLNLGLRDVAELSELIIGAVQKRNDVGSEIILKSYERQRRTDNMLMAGATDTLNAIFSNEIAPLRMMRRVGLRTIQKIPTAKRFFMKQAMGTSGLLPALIKNGKF